MRALLATAAAVSWAATLTSAAATVPTYNDRDNLCAARRLGQTTKLRPNPIDPIASDDGDFYGIDNILDFGKRVFFGSSQTTATSCRNLPPIVNDDADTPFEDVWKMIAGLGSSVGNVVPPVVNDDADTPFGDVWKMITGINSVGPPEPYDDDYNVPFGNVWKMKADSASGRSSGGSSNSDGGGGGDGCAWRTELAEITFVTIRVVGGAAVSGSTGITRIAGRTFPESVWSRARSFVDGYEVGTAANGQRTLQQTFTATLSPGTNAAPLLMPALAAATWVEMDVVRVQVDSRYGAERVSMEVRATGPLRDVSVLDGVVTVSMAPVRLQHSAPDAQCVEGKCFPPDPTDAPATDAPPTDVPSTSAPPVAATTPSLSDAIRKAVVRVRHLLTLRGIGRGIKAEVRRLVDVTARTIGDSLTGGLGGGTTVTCIELCCAVEPFPEAGSGGAAAGGKTRLCWSSCDLDSARWAAFVKAVNAAGGAGRAGAVAQANGDAELDLQGKSMSLELESEVVGASITVGAVGQIVSALEEDKTLEESAAKDGFDVVVANLGVTDHGFRGGEAESDGGSNTKKTVAIALGVTGGVLLLAIVGGLIFFCTRGKEEAGAAEQRGDDEPSKETPDSIPDGATETTVPF
eukprot:Rhum_TRINITY_DN12037_c0_g1::Rhum_TRINITY_DN12037_c0_g1_i1::g.48503::m.48503